MWISPDQALRAGFRSRDRQVLLTHQYRKAPEVFRIRRKGQGFNARWTLLIAFGDAYPFGELTISSAGLYT
jgi:hypothetical protein